MLYRIRRFGIKQTSKMAGLIYFAIGVILIPFFYLAMNSPVPAGQTPHADKLSPLVLLLVPFFYGLIGYVMTALMLYAYNRIAESAGGIELDIVYAVEPPAGAISASSLQ